MWLFVININVISRQWFVLVIFDNGKKVCTDCLIQSKPNCTMGLCGTPIPQNKVVGTTRDPVKVHLYNFVILIRFSHGYI